MEEKEIKEEVIELPKPENVNRQELNLQRFMDDMQLIGNQVRDSKIRKPTFNYGDLSITNYLLWLVLAELMMLNDKGKI